MQYKLVAVDIDGTLLNSKGVITDKTKASIKKVVDKGIIFTISTGRAIQGVLSIINDLNLDVPFITYNGAKIVKGKSKEILYEQDLASKDAKSILDWGKKFDTTIIVWSQNQLYVNKMNEKAHEYKLISNVEPRIIENDNLIIHSGITKILFIDYVNRISSFQKHLKDKLSKSINFCTSKPHFLEFFDYRVSKANAMRKLGDLYGIQSEEMIAVGDGFNDLSMIMYAGMGVAMGNAPSTIKEKAEYVTLSNDEDGLAYVLDHFFNK